MIALIFLLALFVSEAQAQANTDSYLRSAKPGSLELVYGAGQRYSYYRWNGKIVRWDVWGAGAMPIPYWLSSAFPADKIPEVRFCYQEIMKATGLVFDYRGITESRYTSADNISVVDVAALDNASGINQSYFQGDGYIYDSDTAISSEIFQYEPEVLRCVILHEVLHSLGLQHVSNKNSIMNPDLTRINPQRRIDEGSVEGLGYLYRLIPPINSGYYCPADFNADYKVDFQDFTMFAKNFMRYTSTKYDIDEDGRVGFSDFILFAWYFGLKAQ